jgi:hypothetical protein
LVLVVALALMVVVGVTEGIRLLPSVVEAHSQQLVVAQALLEPVVTAGRVLVEWVIRLEQPVRVFLVKATLVVLVFMPHPLTVVVVVEKAVRAARVSLPEGRVDYTGPITMQMATPQGLQMVFTALQRVVGALGLATLLALEDRVTVTAVAVQAEYIGPPGLPVVMEL